MITEIAGSIEEVFKTFDSDGNGFIDLDELSSCLRKLGCGNIPEVTKYLGWSVASAVTKSWF